MLDLIPEYFSFFVDGYSDQEHFDNFLVRVFDKFPSPMEIHFAANESGFEILQIDKDIPNEYNLILIKDGLAYKAKVEFCEG